MTEINFPWYSRLLGNRYQTILLNNENITLRTWRRETRTYQWNKFKSLPRVSSSLLIHTLQCPGSFTVQGLSREWATKLFKKIYVMWFEARKVKAKKLLEQLKHYNESRGFPRTSGFLSIYTEIEDFCYTVPDFPDESLLPHDTYQTFSQILDLNNNGYSTLEYYQSSFVEKELETYKKLFDTIETNPLTLKQRKACVTDNDNNLVLAGAGTGKTSVMVGRAGYLVKSGQALPSEILMLAFGNKAAEEMDERIQEKLGTDKIKASTFHKAGKEIIQSVDDEGKKIIDLATDPYKLDNLVNGWLEELLKDEDYALKASKYFSEYLYVDKNPFDFTNQGEYIEYLKSNDLRTLKGEKVKSYQECLIANFLYRNGIEYEYEPDYEVKLKSTNFKIYKPDFYLTEVQIYIEHFGVTKDGSTAPWIDKDKYLREMAWKRKTHDDNETNLVETFHYEHIAGELLKNLEQKLRSNNVELKPLPAESLLDDLRDFGAVKQLSKLLSELLQSVKNAYISQEAMYNKAQYAANPPQAYAAIDLFSPIYKRYQEYLKKHNAIDFNDMINKAIDYLEMNLFKPKWKYILVDEFQDISEPRARLIKLLKDKGENVSLFCVGDDWQAIYRFTGSDISFTTNFKEEFGHTSVVFLDKTFRFNNSISDIASKFVTQNPTQVEKKISTHTEVKSPAVTLLREPKSKSIGYFQSTKKCLESISSSNKNKKLTVLILSRYKYLFPELSARKELKREFSYIDIAYDSIHGSKGKEADIVILLGLEKGKSGFPSEKLTHPLLELFLPPAEKFANAEERRLFYVALTRAKTRVYLISDMTNASSFIKELLKNNYPIDLNEFTASEEQVKALDRPCPSCKGGILVARKSARGRFWGCSNYPYCEYTESGCKKCNVPMKKYNRYQECPSCQWKDLICNVCNAPMRKRPGGAFWGCSNFRGDAPFSCKTIYQLRDVKHILFS